MSGHMYNSNKRSDILWPPSSRYYTQSDEVINLLKAAPLLELVSANKATLAMIRPNVANSMKPALIEGTAEATLERNIRDLDVLLKFPFTFDLIAIEEFYSGKAREDQKQRPPEKDFHLKNRWDEFVGIMTSGPTTGLILFSSTANATENWKTQVGGWNIEESPDLDTLRGRFGIHNYNNLLHGSDAPENVLKEIGIIAECIYRNRRA